MTLIVLNLTGVADRLGVKRESIRNLRLPPPDVIVSGVDVPPGTDPDTIAGGKAWFAETIDEWDATRPGPGARTDLYPEKYGF